jgi:hypothetical protein
VLTQRRPVLFSALSSPRARPATTKGMWIIVNVDLRAVWECWPSCHYGCRPLCR